MNESKSNPNPATARRFPRYALDVRLTVHVFRTGETISLWGRSGELGLDGDAPVRLD